MTSSRCRYNWPTPSSTIAALRREARRRHRTLRTDTSARMDPYTPLLLFPGGQGNHREGQTVRRRSLRHAGPTQALYCVATGGIAALLSRRVKRAEIVAFADLGPEAIWRFEVVDFPVIVALDSKGNDISELR